MAPLPSFVRLSLRPAPVGTDGDEHAGEDAGEHVFRRLTENADGSMNYGIRDPPEECDEDGGGSGGSGGGPSAAGPPAAGPSAAGPSNPSNEDVVFQEERSRVQVDAERKRKAKAEGRFVDLTESPRKTVKTEEKGMQPANHDAKQLTPQELDFKRRNDETVYNQTKRQASEAALRASTFLLDGNLDDGLRKLAVAREKAEYARYVKAQIEPSGGPPPGNGSSDAWTGIRTLLTSRAAATAADDGEPDGYRRSFDDDPDGYGHPYGLAERLQAARQQGHIL